MEEKWSSRGPKRDTDKAREEGKLLSPTCDSRLGVCSSHNSPKCCSKHDATHQALQAQVHSEQGSCEG